MGTLLLMLGCLPPLSTFLRMPLAMYVLGVVVQVVLATKLPNNVMFSVLVIV